MSAFRTCMSALLFLAPTIAFALLWAMSERRRGEAYYWLDNHGHEIRERIRRAGL